MRLPFETEVLFESGSFADRPNSLSAGIFNQEITVHKDKFNSRSNVFYHILV